MERFKHYIEIPDPVKKVGKRLRDAGFDAYLVGGCVRDSLLERPVNDFDLTTNATPEQMLEIFFDEKCLHIGESFGIITVVPEDFPEGIEIATYRKDIGSSDGRRPDEVEFTTIEEDVKRRDFTINALFYDMETYEVVDFVGGYKDLDNELIKCVGDPDLRFEEDKLRMLRALRFFNVLRFRIDKGTLESIKRNFSQISVVSRERVWKELHKMSGVPLFDFYKYTSCNTYILEGLFNISTSDSKMDPWEHMMFLNNQGIEELEPSNLLVLLHLHFNIEFDRKANMFKGFSKDEVDKIQFLLGAVNFYKEDKFFPFCKKLNTLLKNEVIDKNDFIFFSKSSYNKGPEKSQILLDFLEQIYSKIDFEELSSRVEVKSNIAMFMNREVRETFLEWL